MSDKVIIDPSIFDRELLEKAYREIHGGKPGNRPISTNGEPMSDMAWDNLNDFIARENIKLNIKKAKEKSNGQGEADARPPHDQD